VRRAALAAIVSALLAPAFAHALSAADAGRVERLIEHVGRQSAVSFVRNGEAFDAQRAARHLRMKLEFSAGRVRSVDEFIDQVAGRSSTTGRPYLVRLADGSEVPAAQWLRAELARIEAKPAPR
jgi:hypothetical protein